MNGEQLRAEFEAWIASPPYEKPLGINPEASGFPGQYRAYEVQLAWEAYQAARAALQSQYREQIINAARAAMNESFEVGDEYGSIGIPSDRAAYLSLLLDEYDHARRVEGEGE